MCCLLPEAISILGYPILEAVVTTLVLSFGFMLFNDYLAPPPELSGPWKFTMTYEDTAYSPYQGLQVTYQVLLLREGLKLSGSGEKIYECGPTQEPKTYTGIARTKIRIAGTIKRKYFARDEVTLLYEEEGLEEGGPRKSSTWQHIVCHRKRIRHLKAMEGRYRSTIADTSGSVLWKRQEEPC